MRVSECLGLVSNNLPNFEGGQPHSRCTKTGTISGQFAYEALYAGVNEIMPAGYLDETILTKPSSIADRL